MTILFSFRSFTQVVEQNKGQLLTIIASKLFSVVVNSKRCVNHNWHVLKYMLLPEDYDLIHRWKSEADCEGKNKGTVGLLQLAGLEC